MNASNEDKLDLLARALVKLFKELEEAKKSFDNVSCVQDEFQKRLKDIEFKLSN